MAADIQRHASASGGAPNRGAALYTPEERQRRDATRWTLVQGVLAPIQFLVFLVSTVLVVRFLMTGAGEGLAIASILLKTLLLYTIMVTGSIWEKVVFGKWLFAEPFWWEDFVSFLVIGLHTLYLAALLRGWWSSEARMGLALLAYAIYAMNATQFLLKLRAARLQAAAEDMPSSGATA
ncbi:MAG: 2-vinyl bacteriochlorophyllide hydratase [Sandaracinobacter sp.]